MRQAHLGFRFLRGITVLLLSTIAGCSARPISATRTRRKLRFNQADVSRYSLFNRERGNLHTEASQHRKAVRSPFFKDWLDHSAVAREVLLGCRQYGHFDPASTKLPDCRSYARDHHMPGFKKRVHGNCGDLPRRIFATQSECGRLDSERSLSSLCTSYSTRRIDGFESSNNR